VRNLPHPVALTIAGSDPSGGAGAQADLKTFHRFGVYGEAVITLLTVQNTRRVSRVACVDAALVAGQIEAVIEDIPPRAAKTGALGNRGIVEAVAAAAARFDFPLVVDPVTISKHGAPLLDAEAVSALRRLLLPHAALVAPNLPEAAALTGVEIRDGDDAREAARRLCALGARAALIKGGHWPDRADDLLYSGGVFHEFPAARIATRNTHGAGCTYSAAVAACLALGLPLVDAVARAKRFVARAIETGPGLGAGQGPLNHFESTE
jgi:hydroxymethylpyrimidine/phosphomethylpyrimidine kinase